MALSQQSPAPTILTRAEARALGLARYFTGKPCINDHFSERSTNFKYCMQCQRDADKKRYQDNPGRNKLYPSQALTHVRVRRRIHYSKNSKSISEKREERRNRNREAVRAKCRQYAANRRAREKGAFGTYSSQDVARIFKEQKQRCAYCQHRLDCYHVDHIVPLALNGSNEPSNLQILCPSCNRSKHAKHPIEFAQERGMLL
jgi:5-methylcytosine-specific restriction endonuclease McrA